MPNADRCDSDVQNSTVSKQFQTQPMSSLQLGGIELNRFAITTDVLLVEPPVGSPSSLTPAQIYSTSFSLAKTDAGEQLYGVYAGTGDVVDREFVIAQGFIPVDEPETHTLSSTQHFQTTSSEIESESSLIVPTQHKPENLPIEMSLTTTQPVNIPIEMPETHESPSTSSFIPV